MVLKLVEMCLKKQMRLLLERLLMKGMMSGKTLTLKNLQDNLNSPKSIVGTFFLPSKLFNFFGRLNERDGVLINEGLIWLWNWF